MFRKQLNYANVVASLALFIALGGGAVAAVTIPRDSVGAPEIRKDAVRTSEIREETIKLADIGDGARDALLGDVEVREEDDVVFPVPCNSTDLTVCRNLLAMRLNTHDDESAGRGRPPSGGPAEPTEGRNWLVQAKLTIVNDLGRPAEEEGRCGLVLDSSSGQDTLLDEARHHLEDNENPGEAEAIALSAVFGDDRIENPRIAMRCTNQTNKENLAAEDQKITALEVGKVIER